MSRFIGVWGIRGGRSLGELNQRLGLTNPGDGLIDRVDLRGVEEASEIFDSSLDAVVPCEARNVDAARVHEEVGHCVVEGTVRILVASHCLGDEEDILPLTLTLHDRISQRRIESSPRSIADAVDRPWATRDIETTVVSRMLVHGDDDSVVLGMVLLDVSGEVIHRWDRAFDGEGAGDEVVLGIYDQQDVHD